MGGLEIEPSSTKFQIQGIHKKFIQALTILSGLKGGEKTQLKCCTQNEIRPCLTLQVVKFPSHPP